MSVYGTVQLEPGKGKLPEQVFADAVMDISNGGPQMDR